MYVIVLIKLVVSFIKMVAINNHFFDAKNNYQFNLLILIDIYIFR